MMGDGTDGLVEEQWRKWLGKSNTSEGMYGRLQTEAVGLGDMIS